MPDNKSISQARNSEWRNQRGCLAVFFSFFLIAGLAFSYFFLVRPISLVLQAKNWQQVPCTVVSSEVKRHRDSDGTTYSVYIVYKYHVGIREYESDRYQFVKVSSSGRAGKKRIVDQYPPGKQAHCFVDPRDPTQAVLNRNFTADMLIGLLPIAFVLVGGIGLVYTLRKGPADPPQEAWRPAAEPSWSIDVRQGKATPWGPIVLESQQSPLAKFLGIIALALFWNGIVSIFVWQAIEGFRQGRPEWFLTVFITPFAVIGLVLIGGIGYTFLSLFSPRPTLTLGTGRLTLGDTTSLTWRFLHNSGSIRHLSIQLEGKEEAQYRRGTTNHTDTEIFFKHPLVDTTDPLEIAGGRIEFTIPADTMHTFEAEHNKIVWGLHLTGEIGWWPDLNETYPITLLPLSSKETGLR
jgi:hypothetical protein